MKSFPLFLILAVLLIGCQNQNDRPATVQYTESGDTISLKLLNHKSDYENLREAINTGNPMRYDCVNESNPCGTCFLLDLIMANKYHYARAYENLYDYYISPEFHKSEWDALDTVSQHRALYYLQRAAEAGSPNAQNLLGHLYLNGNALPKDIKKGKYWIKQSEEKQWGIAQVRCWFWWEKWHFIYTQKY